MSMIEEVKGIIMHSSINIAAFCIFTIHFTINLKGIDANNITIENKHLEKIDAMTILHAYLLDKPNVQRKVPPIGTFNVVFGNISVSIAFGFIFFCLSSKILCCLVNFNWLSESNQDM